MSDEIPGHIENNYRRRVVDSEISNMLEAFGGVHIKGPKWCGKTWTGMYHSRSVQFVGDEDSAYVAELDPELALTGKRPRLIDEWQDVPKLWDVARRMIDIEHEKGMFIFTGSVSSPKKATHHTGIGRFAEVRMRPMSLFESGDSSGAISLSNLFDGGKIINTKSSMNYRDAVRLICRGGWPSALGLDDDIATRVAADYLKKVKGPESSLVDDKKRNEFTMGLLLRSLARNSSESPTAQVLIDDMTERGSPPAINTLTDYLEYLRKIFVIDDQKAWLPSLRSKTRLRSRSKIHFADPSLAAAALDASPEVLARNPTTAGQLFESLCYRDLSVHTSALDGNVFHYLDSTGLEVDEIIELRNGKWGAIEVKLGTSEIDKAALNLRTLRDRVGEGMPEPSFLAVLSATCGLAYTRDDGVLVIPIDMLGP
jgi:predicted AAA+ superfamily ATPase